MTALILALLGLLAVALTWLAVYVDQVAEYEQRSQRQLRRELRRRHDET